MIYFSLVQEDLKILRLSTSLLVEDEVKMRETELEKILAMKKSAKVHNCQEHGGRSAC